MRKLTLFVGFGATFLVWIGTAQGSELPLCGAHVIKNRTLFLFPVLREPTKWAWHRASTEDNRLEYSWEVYAPAEAPQVSFGAYLFKFPGDQPKHGALKDLLRFTQTGAAKVTRTVEGDVFKLEHGVKVDALEVDNGVVIAIPDFGKLKGLVGKPINKVRFVVRHPDPDSSITCEATIRYEK